MTAKRLQAGWTGPDGWALREETAEDADFIAALYADTRREELAPVPWPEEAKQSFLREQYQLQHDHYRAHYPRAEFLLIEHAGKRAGRIYISRGHSEIRLMEIALLRELRGQGIGGLLLGSLLEEARSDGRTVSLHVEPDNPAQRLYQRLGFERIEQRGVYDYLEWQPAVTA